MRKAAKSNPKLAGPQHIAHCLADWWTRPDTDRMALWASAGYQEHAVSIWREVVGSAPAESVKKLLSVVAVEQAELAAEYERLFVGPAAIPCPPYEAVWRKDRPKHEQGTVMGQSTAEVVRLYRDLGLRLRADQMELADHVAIELEALAFAMDTRAEIVPGLFERLRLWIPDFCASVIDSSNLEFYRGLAGITRQL